MAPESRFSARRAGPMGPRAARRKRGTNSKRRLRGGCAEARRAGSPGTGPARPRAERSAAVFAVSSEVGIDIIETARIRNVFEKYPRRFLDRVYTEWEQLYCRNNILHLSGRWAAKEAVSKVLGLGVRGVGWREIEIRRTRAGQPTVTLHGRAAARRDALGLRDPLSVSISHIRDLAVAVAVGLR